MILTCDKCFTRYLVDIGAIYAQGRVVRCSKCGHSWRQEPLEVPPQEPLEVPLQEQEAAQEIPAQPADTQEARPEAVFAAVGLSAMPSSDRLPIIRIARTPPTPLWLKLLPFVLLLLLAILGLVLYKDSVLKAVPDLQPFYKVIGLYDTKGVVLREISLAEKEDGIYVDGKLVNESAENKNVPLIRITLLDENRRPVGSHILPPVHALLEPAAELPLHGKLPVTEREASFVAVDIGNTLELLLR